MIGLGLVVLAILAPIAWWGLGRAAMALTGGWVVAVRWRSVNALWPDTGGEQILALRAELVVELDVWEQAHVPWLAALPIVPGAVLAQLLWPLWVPVVARLMGRVLDRRIERARRWRGDFDAPVGDRDPPEAA